MSIGVHQKSSLQNNYETRFDKLKVIMKKAMSEDGMSKWAGAGAGVGFALGVLREIYFQFVSQSLIVSDLLLTAAGSAFIGGIVGALLFVVFSTTVSLAAQSNNSFIKGMVFVLVPLSVCAGIDLVLLRGTYVFFPILSLMSDGTLQGTYYSCTDWIVVEEGSYCNDDWQIFLLE